MLSKRGQAFLSDIEQNSVGGQLSHPEDGHPYPPNRVGLEGCGLDSRLKALCLSRLIEVL